VAGGFFISSPHASASPSSPGVIIEMPLYAHGDLWQWLEAAAPARTVHDKLCGLGARSSNDTSSFRGL
jgi:hypothetical protein